MLNWLWMVCCVFQVSRKVKGEGYVLNWSLALAHHQSSVGLSQSFPPKWGGTNMYQGEICPQLDMKIQYFFLNGWDIVKLGLDSDNFSV